MSFRSACSATGIGDGRAARRTLERVETAACRSLPARALLAFFGGAAGRGRIGSGAALKMLLQKPLPPSASPAASISYSSISSGWPSRVGAGAGAVTGVVAAGVVVESMSMRVTRSEMSSTWLSSDKRAEARSWVSAVFGPSCLSASGRSCRHRGHDHVAAGGQWRIHQYGLLWCSPDLTT